MTGGVTQRPEDDGDERAKDPKLKEHYLPTVRGAVNERNCS